MARRALIIGITGQDGSYAVEESFPVVGLEWEKYVHTDPRYFRPTEVDPLQGDNTKARRELSWKPQTSFKQLIKMMVDADWRPARQGRPLKESDSIMRG